MVHSKNRFLVLTASLVAIVFGVLTIKSGGTVLFGSDEARDAAGNYIPFVLWFNFIAGFAYIVSGVGIWGERRWGATLAAIIAVATVITFIALGVHVYLGGDYEQRTVMAMTLRTLVWLTIATFLWRYGKQI